MNFVGGQISDALQVWDNVNGSVKSTTNVPATATITAPSPVTKSKAAGSSGKSSGLDMTFITPSLLAVGRLNDSRVDSLAHTLSGQPALFWNLSGKPLSNTIVRKLHCQVIDFPWTTPGHFTQAPSLECVFRQCYSIKAWLDLKSKNVAVIHCGNGKSRTGILIACYLRYTSAFPRVKDGFEFFCNTRLQSNITPVLSPSYQILFENVDRATDHGGRPNPYPLHLKCLAISGLPVDDMPCLEVWDMHGLVFNSHSGMTASPTRCAWSTEYGDGFFRVAADLRGDFSIMCRFGGSHALTRDKTTLIFKYQNSTGFLPPDVIELSKRNVDVNPEYTDSLEDATFTVHLMFDAVSEAAMQKARMEKTQFVDAYQLRGQAAFDAGLDEISKHHLVEPEATVCDKLLSSTCPPHYAGVLAQLANNNSGVALKIMHFAMKRATQLAALDSSSPARSPLPTSPYLVKHSKSSLGVSKSGDGARMSMQSSFQSDVAVQRLFQEDKDPFEKSVLQKAIEFNGEHQELDNKKSGTTTSKRVADSDDDDDVDTPQRPTFGSKPKSRPAPSPPKSMSPAIPKCSVCEDDSAAKDDQLVNCTVCQLGYHAICVGARRIPFTLKSAKERENRTKYIQKHYSSWKCKSCKELEGSPTSGQNGHMTADSSISNGHEGSKNSQDLAKLMTILSSSGLSVDELVQMDESEQKKALLAATAQHQQSTSSTSSVINGDLDINGALQALPHAEPITQAPSDPRYNKYVKMFQVGLPVSIIRTKMKAEGLDPDLVLNPAVPLPPLPLTSNPSFSQSGGRGGAGSAGLSRVASKQNVASRSSSSVSTTSQDGEWQQQLPSENPRYSKYFNMLKVGLPLTAVAQKLHSDGLASSVQIATMILNNTPPPSSSGGTDETRGRSDSAGTTTSSVPASGTDSGGGTNNQQDSSSKSSSVMIGNDDKGRLNSKDNIVVDEEELKKIEEKEAAALSSKKKNDGAEPLIVLQESMMYGKFFRMLKVGLPKNTIKMKMQQAGLDPSMLDRNPKDELTMKELAASRQKSLRTQESAEEEDKKDDEKENATGTDQSGGDGSGQEEAGECVPLEEHPVYAKYFKMLKVGLPLAMVKTKLLNQETDTEGVVDPDVLTLDPSTLHPIKLREKEPEAAPEEMIALQDHPDYGRYLKMMKVGLPLIAAKAKMKEDGFDPDLLDRDLTAPVPVDPTSTLRAKAKKAALATSPKPKVVRKKKLHWKAIDVSKLGDDSVWAEDEVDIKMDDEEFNRLFVESDSKSSAQSLAKSSKDALKKQQSLLDMKRGQNGGIALARLKMSFGEVRERILKMDDTAFTAEQFRSLQEYLPTTEESLALRRYLGDPEQLGVAERYMLEMLNNLPSTTVGSNCLDCILYKQQFKTIISELNDSITRVENACDDVKMSPKLKMVLRTILKVGNQMNGGEDRRGFSLDSLLKLQSAKAFDKKTNVLQYIVKLIYNNDESCLQFPEDLVHLADAVRISVEGMIVEKSSLETEQAKCTRLMQNLREENDGRVQLSDMEDFLERAAKAIEVLEEKLNKMQKKFVSVLDYFGEESSMGSQEFFETLKTFVDAFIEERSVYERIRKAEARKSAVAAQAAAAPSRQQRAVTLNQIEVDPYQLRLDRLDLSSSPASRSPSPSPSTNVNSPNKPLPRKPTRRNSTFT